jgi:putative endonuclease
VNYTYIVECSDGSLYTGWTNHLKKRMQAHNMGKGAKYTRARRPVKLVYHEQFATKQAAMKREAQIKKLTRKEKLLLIHGKPAGEESEILNLEH